MEDSVPNLLMSCGFNLAGGERKRQESERGAVQRRDEGKELFQVVTDLRSSSRPSANSRYVATYFHDYVLPRL